MHVQDIIAVSIAIGGYLCGALPMASYVAQISFDSSDPGFNSVRNAAAAHAVSFA